MVYESFETPEFLKISLEQIKGKTAYSLMMFSQFSNQNSFLKLDEHKILYQSVGCMSVLTYSEYVH